MRRLSRRAAIGSTALSLLLAATGTSLAAVRAARYQGGVAPPGVALPAPGTNGAAPGGALVEPDASLPPVEADGSVPPAILPAPPGVGNDPGPPAPPGTAAAPTTTTTSTSTTAPGASPAPAQTGRGSSAQPSRSAQVPFGGPTPTLPPGGSPSPTTGCPADVGRGALPPPIGRVKAVSYVLPWPGPTPLVLMPQRGATRPAGGDARISQTSAGDLGPEGSSIVLNSPEPTDYTLVAGDNKAEGAIRFTGIGRTVNIDRTACRDRSFVLHDVGEETLAGRALRIVGVVAPPGLVTIDDHGGTAHFRSPTAGTYQVTILTASDAGVAAPLITASITVR